MHEINTKCLSNALGNLLLQHVSLFAENERNIVRAY